MNHAQNQPSDLKDKHYLVDYRMLEQGRSYVLI
jgi:hypothetical protein